MEEIEAKQAEIIAMLHDSEGRNFRYIAYVMNTTASECEWLYNNYYQVKAKAN